MTNRDNSTTNIIQTNRAKRPYTVVVVDNDYLRQRWDEIDALLYEAFENVAFHGNFTRTRPAEYTWQNVEKPYQKDLNHVMAIDVNNDILGALFVVPCYKPEGKEECDVGWMFTVKLDRAFRREVMGAIINKVHEVTFQAGFARIVTEVGTKAGAKFLCKNHGYVHTPIPKKDNRYTRELGT